MKVMVIGDGGREHAIITKIMESNEVEKIYWVTAKNKKTYPKVDIVAIDALDFNALTEFAKTNAITYTVVGPELPLTEGIVDSFKNQQLLIFGPDKNGAKMEASKTFAKDIMLKNSVPTARYEEIKNIEHGYDVISRWGTPIVIKVDGLAQGKGVIIAQNKSEANAALEEMIEKYPQQKIFVEEFFEGPEISFMVLVSNNKYVSLVPARDYKRIYAGNEGPNTGGMGAIAWQGLLTKEEKNYIEKEIIEKTLEGLEKEGIVFTGILYAGLIMTKNGPKVLEYNTRLGDPEAQSILQLLDCDFAKLLYQACKGEMPEELSVKDKVALTMVMASEGYPNTYKTGFEITGMEDVECHVFQAGTEFVDGKTLTAGGRVLNLTAIANTVEQCRDIIYREQQKVTFLGKYFRNDIGL